MTTEMMRQRGIRTVNMKLEVHKKLMLMKVKKEYESVSDLVGDLLNYYVQKTKKLERKDERNKNIDQDR